MSGVMAMLSLDGRAVPIRAARAQLALASIRGDGEPRLLVEPAIAIGAAHRATTPEAERERQPALDARGRYIAAWDGRLDNRDDLARLLDFDAERARTATDLDYVLEAYARWGDACLDRLVGDWAIVIWDRVRQRLLCAKDPLGWRPLFFAQEQGRLMVGSDLRQLFGGGIVPRDANFEYVERFLADARPAPLATPHRAVSELEGGEALVAEHGRVEVRRWWRAPEVTPRHYRHAQEYVDEFVEVFRTATKARLRSNRRMGVYLSGGLDSSYVALVAADLGVPLVSITGYAGGIESIDERTEARAVAEVFGLPQVEVDIGECWALSSRWLGDAAFDEPRMPPQAAHMIRFALAAREAGCEVMFNGEGGDEWLDGDPRFLADVLVHYGPRRALGMVRRHWPYRSPVRTVARSVFDAFGPSPVHRAVYTALGRHYGQVEMPVLMARPAGWHWQRDLDLTQSWRRRHALDIQFERHRERSRPVRSWAERHTAQPYGIETRSPFHDLRVMELTASIPTWAKRYQGRHRDILRDAGERLMPGGIFGRTDKTYFDELIKVGLTEREPARLEQAARRLEAYPGVRATTVQQALRGRADVGTRWWTLWAIGAAGQWLRYIDAAPTTPGPRDGAIDIERLSGVGELEEVRG